MPMSSGKALSERTAILDKEEGFADEEGDVSGVRKTEADRVHESSYLNIEPGSRLDE
jgi:hypothetical protein